MALFDWIFKGKDVGLTTTDGIIKLFNRIYDLPPSLTIFEIDSSFKGYELSKITGVASNKVYAKQVTVPREFPSMVMCFSEFKVCYTLLKRLKIPNNREKFKTDIDAAIQVFFEDKGQNPLTEKIVFQVKQAIARLDLLSLIC